MYCVCGCVCVCASACVSIFVSIRSSICQSPCLSVCLLVFLSVCMLIGLYICLCVCMCLYVYQPVLSVRESGCECLWMSAYLYICLLFICTVVMLSVWPSVCLSVDLSVCLTVCLPVCLSVYLSICLPVCLPACLFACLSVCPSICLSACLFVCPSPFFFSQIRFKCPSLIESGYNPCACVLRPYVPYVIIGQSSPVTCNYFPEIIFFNYVFCKQNVALLYVFAWIINSRLSVYFLIMIVYLFLSHFSISLSQAARTYADTHARARTHRED